MADKFDSLTDEDVRQIGLLIEMLDRSSFDYLQIDTGHLKVTVGKGAPPTEAHVAPAPTSAAVPTPRPTTSVGEARAAPAPVQPPSATATADDVVAITAPMIGRFYAQPEPGAPPFVGVGAAVSPGTTVGLIEVMKVFTAVEAAVSGVISEICVQDGAFVEFGSVLFRVKKQGTALVNPTGSSPPAKARTKR